MAAVAIGSGSGALVHLCTALDMPWLPQTFLIPVRQSGVHPDEPKRSLEAGLEPGRRLLEANPELQLHHMHDANQDRLMLEYMSYFRVKRLRLGEAYERFLRERLMPGGTIVISECRRSWPVTELGERHYFQHGALGGATPEEFLYGSERVARYLERYGSHVRRWDSPEPTTEAPEAEWGFAEALGVDIEAFARSHGFRIVRMVFDEPEHPSPLVAELHRAWFRERQIEANRLLVSSFIVMEPYWAMRTGSVPFWMKFNMEASLEWLRAYLDEAEPYDDIHLMLFAHGVECVGLPSLECWRELLGRALRHGAFAGVDEKLFPRDFAVFGRYHDSVRQIPARHPLPEFMTLERFKRFVTDNEGRFPVVWKPAGADFGGVERAPAGRRGSLGGSARERIALLHRPAQRVLELTACPGRVCAPLIGFAAQTLLEQRQHGGFLASQAREVLAQHLLDPPLQELQHAAVEIALDDLGMDVALAAHGDCIAELGCHPLDRARHVALGGRLGVEALELAERQRRQHGPRPGAEILGREGLARDLLQIGVHVRRIDLLPLPIVVDVLEEVLAGELLAGAHDARQPAITQRRAVPLAALAAIFEDDLCAREVDVAVAHGGKPVAAILAGIFLIADPDERDLQKAHDGRQDLLAGQPAARLVLSHARAKTRQRPGEREHAVELGGVADRAPIGMVAVLLAASRIAPGRLQVAFAIGADPDLGPGRGYGQPLDAAKLRTVPDQAPIGVTVAEGAARAPTRDARHGVGHVAQAHRARRRGGIRLVRGRCRRCLTLLHSSPPRAGRRSPGTGCYPASSRPGPLPSEGTRCCCRRSGGDPQGCLPD
jgi:hypothetical protein